MKLTFFLTFLLVSIGAFGQGQNFPGGGGGGGGSAGATTSGAPSAAYTFFPSTSGTCASGTYSATGTTYCAQNNGTGTVDFTGSDAGPVIQSAITARASVGGRFFFKNGVYNINSLTQESTGGFTLFYAIGIPGTCGATNQYCKWIFEGESIAGFVGEVASMPVQTGGVILNITSTAVTAAGAATNEIVGIWARPDTNSLGATGILSHVYVRFPTNQRGCEAAVDPSQALDWEYDNVIADFNIAYTSLAVPVAGAGCAGGEPSGLFGLVTTNSIKNDNWIKNSHAVGYDTAIDIRSEHTYMVHSGGQFCNVAIAYGVNGSTSIFHPSVIADSGWGECLRGLTIGTNTVLGATLNIFGLDIEDATASKFPTFQPVYHAIEQNAGSTNGQASYAVIQAGVGGIVLSNLFDGGGGALFTQSTTNFWPLAKGTSIIDNFTRPNNASLGLPWIAYTWAGATNPQIVSNSVQANGFVFGISAFNGQTFTGDQFSKGTIQTVAGASGSTVIVLTNASTTPATRTYYEYFCSNIAANGSGIVKFVAGVSTTLASQTTAVGCANGDTIELRHIGTWLYALHNGVMDTNFSPNPVSDSSITNGQPGLAVSPANLQANAAFSQWSGGSIISPVTSTAQTGTLSGNMIAAGYGTQSNCAGVGTAANPSVASCTSASGGTVSCATASGGNCQVNTTAITANSQVFVWQDESTTAGTRLAVTCNTTDSVINPIVTAKVAGTSFTFHITAPTTNPACFSYEIRN